MSKHTPGPWEVSEFSAHVLANETAVCKFESIHGMYPNYTTNARLIAAAPELLEALKDLLESAYPPHELDDTPHDFYDAAKKKARAAIAKAEEEAAASDGGSITSERFK